MRWQAPRKPPWMLRPILNFERRAHTSKSSHKDSIVALLQPGQDPPLHLARGYKLYAAGHFRRRMQLWDCSQLHLPCCWGNSIGKSGKEMGK